MDDTAEAVMRRFAENLSDEAIVGVVESLVAGLVRGMLAEAIRNVDTIVDNIVAGITDQMASAGATQTVPDLHLVTDPSPGRPPRGRDRVRHTCEVCGREGSRRFIQTPSGWRCSPTATKCTANKTVSASDIAAKPFTADVTPVRADPGPAVREIRQSLEPTAHCQDCSRTWTLTGIPLQAAAEQHEQQRGHIVTINEAADA